MTKTINRAIYLKYKKEMLGKFIDADKAYWNQCVDLIRDYCKKARNYGMGQLPSAKDANNIKTFPWLKSIVVWTDDLWSGDIIITWATQFNKYGHIAIIDTIWKSWPVILEQNGKGGGTKIEGNQIRTRGTRRGNILKVFRFVKYS
jgi:hypothetical protein